MLLIPFTYYSNTVVLVNPAKIVKVEDASASGHAAVLSIEGHEPLYLKETVDEVLMKLAKHR